MNKPNPITPEEIATIKDRSERYRKNLLGDETQIPVDSLSDIGMMCIVDIPRLISHIQSFSGSNKKAEDRTCLESNVKYGGNKPLPTSTKPNCIPVSQKLR